MIKLDTPVQVGSRLYTHLHLAEATFSFHSRKISKGTYGFATVETDMVRLGSEDVSDEDGRKITPAPAALQVSVEDENDDPAIQAMFVAIVHKPRSPA